MVVLLCVIDPSVRLRERAGEQRVADTSYVRVVDDRRGNLWRDEAADAQLPRRAAALVEQEQARAVFHHNECLRDAGTTAIKAAN